LAQRGAALPAAPGVPSLDDLPRRPWTPQRTLYTCLLWLLWSVGVVWLILLGWHEGKTPNTFSVLLEPAPYATGFKVAYWLTVALTAGVPLRLFVDNPRMSFIPIGLGLFVAAIACFETDRNIKGADLIGGQYVSTKRVVLKKVERSGRGKFARADAKLDHPTRPARLITYPENWVPGTPGETLCIDLIAGQFGGLWALPPKKCPGWLDKLSPLVGDKKS
jgi:hypothetical protein